MSEMTIPALMHIVEAVLFVIAEPVEIKELARTLEVTDLEIHSAVRALEDACELERRGVRVMRFGTKIQLATRAEYLPYIQKVVAPQKTQQLSQAALETLSIIAYRQPVTRGEIESIRGVKCDYSIQLLLSRGLIEELGVKETVGRPILYGTSELFLRHFGLRALGDLPRVEVREEDGEVRLEPPQEEEAEQMRLL